MTRNTAMIASEAERATIASFSPSRLFSSRALSRCVFDVLMSSRKTDRFASDDAVDVSAMRSPKCIAWLSAVIVQITFHMGGWYAILSFKSWFLRVSARKTGIHFSCKRFRIYFYMRSDGSKLCRRFNEAGTLCDAVAISL